MAEELPAETLDRGAAEADARLVRGVRLRLVAWSGGSTLLVLLALGIALYLSVATSLQATAVANLEDRADQIISFVRGQPPTDDDSPIEVIFGGGGSTFAILIGPDGTAVGPRQFQMPGGLPDTDATAAAAKSGRDIRLGQIPVPTYTLPQTITVPVRELTLQTNA